MRRMSRAITCALALGLAACGSGGETRTVTVDRPAATPTPAPAAAQATATPEGGPDGDALVEGEGSVDGERVRFVITELRRSGPTVLLNARVEQVAKEDLGNLRIGRTFSDGRQEALEQGGREDAGVFDGVALIDPAGRRQYLVARDAAGRCVCSNDLGAAFVSEAAPVELQATLTAPPPEVKQVDVYVPRVRTFRGVALAE